MKKDVIYIDIEDDITSVIERIKASSEKIIALVPPKGNAVLQSVVNLKLLKRAADSAGKQPVIVTNNHALTTLAGSLDFYIAKNLQSKPALVRDSSVEEAEDEVEISDSLADLDDTGRTVSLADLDESDEVELSSEELESLNDDKSSDKDEKSTIKAKKSKNKGIPNFDNFRKKLLIGGGIALLLLILFLTVFGRAKASVVIRAETTPVDVAFDMNLNANTAQSDPNTYNLKALYQQSQKTISQSFSPTGQKDLGTKASGQMSFSIKCSDVDGSPPTISSGTSVSSNSLTFLTQQAVSLTTPSFNGGCKFTGSTTVVAQNNGDQYNLSPRSYSVAGYSSVSGSGSQMSGGTSKIVKVVSQSDVDKAKEQISQQDVSQVKDELKKAMGADVTIFDDSFAVTFGDIVSEPAVGQEANDGKLTASTTYSMLGVTNKDLGASLDAFVVTKMTNKDQQRVYDNGIKNVKFEKVSSTDKTAVYKVSTLAQYGPQFDTEELKNNLAGKKFGEMRSYLQDLPGVKGVDIKLSPFWARKAPNASRIKISLDVDKNNSGR